MSTLLKFPISSSPDAFVLVEVAELKPAGQLVRASRAIDQAIPAPAPLEKTLEKALPAVQILGDFLEQAKAAGLHAKLEVGLKLTNECDVILVAPDAQATFKLTLRPAP
jgi:hypothetical protein